VSRYRLSIGALGRLLEDVSFATLDAALLEAKLRHRLHKSAIYVHDTGISPSRVRAVHDGDGASWMGVCAKCRGTGAVTRAVPGIPALIQTLACGRCSGTKVVKEGRDG
jgi:hypothetical protein